ncbi:MAG TPA: NAD(P)-dependent oxidoreductase [Chitinophagaceae bacterium]|nr:NAD(P)-dependent oxidoreductase [Chitinophagaceae bacterium]
MKKVLVTGATGFIGNYVVRELLNRNCEVIATSSSTEKAKNSDWFHQVNYTALNLDLSDDQVNLFNFFNQPDLLIHLAWEGLPNYKAQFHLKENLPRHKLFLTNLISNGLKDISVTGTCFEYGMKEGPLREDMPTDPANPYALAKDELRKFLQQLQEREVFDMKWIRLFYMYGRGQSPNSLLSQLDKALENGEATFNMSGGEQVRDYLPVGKVAEIIVDIALQERITGIVNCCSAEPISVKQLVKNYLDSKQASIQQNLGYYPYPDYEPMSFWGDNTKLKQVYNDGPGKTI